MVDVTGLERFVKGEILPMREGGAKRALKYEDLLFLKEGKLERQNWTLAANAAAKANKVAAPSRWMEKDVFESAVCSGTWSDYRDANKEITEGLKNYGPIEDIVGDVVALGNYEAGRTPKLERLEKAYENIGKLKRTLGTFHLNGWEERVIWKEFDWRTGTVIEEGTSDWWARDIYIYEHIVFPFAANRAEAQLHEFRLTGDVISEVQYPYAKRAWAIFYVLTDVNGGGGEDYLVKECSVTPAANGQPARVRLASVDFVAIAQEALGRHGGTYKTEPALDGGNQSVMLHERRLLVEHGFPASEPEVG